ncbi:hypothetical protein C2S51_010651 [Perilla frutescens var. frutescens]|nr:hypothetical protein C2S51_010651 [Perilla frutescens var. frutescens]
MLKYCKNCKKRVRAEDHDNRTWCTYCGIMLAEDCFREEVSFVKTADGQSRMAGNFVRTAGEGSSESRQRTVEDAYDGIQGMMNALGIDGGEDKANYALGLYKIALGNDWTKGRRKELVLAACLYIMCRKNEKPYLLIDFSEHLRTNVYVVGAVFLQLCKLLHLQEDPVVVKLLDPSLFIHRFADRVFRERNQSVSNTALRIVASMKRDWMQTGRKPSGLCGAALYISALIHGLNCSKSQIIKAVHICEATLTKRLIEFENTESGGLTVQDKSDEMMKRGLGLGEKQVLCEHKGSGSPHYAYGLCSKCFTKLMKLSGGFNGGSEPPAFQRAETERRRTMELAAADDHHTNTNNDFNLEDYSSHSDDDDTNLSDIDDPEVDACILDDKEKKYKTIVWEEMNKEYLEEQAEKEAAKKAFETILSNSSEDARKQLLLAAQNRKEKRQRRAADLKNLGSPQTAAQAAKQMLQRKGLSSRFRQDKMDEMFQKEDDPDDDIDNTSAKKSRTEPEPEADDGDDYSEDNEEDFGLDGNGEGYVNYTEDYNNYDEGFSDMDDY